MTVGPQQPDFSIHAFKEGKPEAFAYIFEQLYPAIRVFAARLLQNTSIAEDIAQETFIKLWEKRTAFESPQRIKAFLYITARNACFNYMKRSKTGTRNFQQWSRSYNDTDDNVLKQLTTSEVGREINFIVSMLPPECGKIVRHAYIDGMDNQQIANLLNISVHTVKNQKARAIYLMRKKLGSRSLFLLALALLEMKNYHFQFQDDNLLFDTAEVRTVAKQSEYPAVALPAPELVSDFS